MAITDPVERAAILLNGLGLEVAEPVLEVLDPDRATLLRERLGRFQTAPPSDDDTDEVFQEFDRLLRFATESTHQLKIADVEDDSDQETLEDDDQDDEPEPPDPLTLSDDPFEQLSYLEPAQIAGALKGEHPRILALVLNCTEPEKAGKTMNLIEEEVRNEVFLQMCRPGTSSDELVRRVLVSVVERGKDISPEVKEDSETFQKMANILRSLDKEDRSKLLESAEEADPDLVKNVKDLLYTFEDLLIIEDRSLQRLLGDVDSTTLATALKDCDPKIMDKIMGNLSRRAREALTEEMDFMATIPPAQRLEAEKVITDIIARKDQAGELTMLE